MKNAWERWKALSKSIGKFQARLLFSLLYFLMITPVGLVTKNKDYLRLKGKPSWMDYENNVENLEQMKEQ